MADPLKYYNFYFDLRVLCSRLHTTNCFIRQVCNFGQVYMPNCPVLICEIEAVNGLNISDVFDLRLEAQEID